MEQIIYIDGAHKATSPYKNPTQTGEGYWVNWPAISKAQAEAYYVNVNLKNLHDLFIN